MPRTILAALAATAALSFAACGSDADEASGPSTASVKASVEQAAGVKLVASPIPELARKQGLTASFSNEPDIVEDEQVVSSSRSRTPARPATSRTWSARWSRPAPS